MLLLLLLLLLFGLWVIADRLEPCIQLQFHTVQASWRVIEHPVFHVQGFGCLNWNTVSNSLNWHIFTPSPVVRLYIQHMNPLFMLTIYAKELLNSLFFYPDADAIAIAAASCVA